MPTTTGAIAALTTQIASIEHAPVGLPDGTAARAADHLWMHFAR